MTTALVPQSPLMQPVEYQGQPYFNAFEDRDRLMAADMVRSLMLGGTGQQMPLLSPPGAQPVPKMPFFVADRVHALGYTLSRQQEARLIPALGRAIKAEYRQRYGGDPHQSSRFVDGAVRQVNVYSVAWSWRAGRRVALDTARADP